MKKSVIAAAVAAVLAVPTMAMAAVNVSGGLQAEVVSVGGDGANGATPTGLYANDGMEYGKQDSGSYGFLKFSASEDLGNGLTALAMWNGVANVGVANSNVAGGLTGRDSYVGLSGGFGTVVAGTASSAYKSATVGWDPFLATSLQARGSGGMSPLQNGYVSSAVAYINTFGGVKFVGAVALDQAHLTGTATNGKTASTFSLNAPFGPVDVALAYINVSNFGGGAANATATKIGVKWNSGPITLAGQVESLDKGMSADYYGAATPQAGTVTWLSGTYAMGNNSISASYGTTSKKLTGNAKDETYMAVGLFHHFSKTTESWVGYRATDPGTAASAKESALALGLRVAF